MGLTHHKLCFKAVVDGSCEPFFIVLRCERIARAIGILRDSERKLLKFIAQIDGLGDFRQNGAAQHHNKFFHGWVWHQSFLQCQNQQFIFAGSLQKNLRLRIIQIVLLADDRAHETTDFLVWQAFMLQERNRIQCEVAIHFINCQMLSAGEHAAVNRIPFSAGFQQLAIMQISHIKLPLQPLGVGDTAKSGGGLPVAVQSLQEMLLCQGRPLGFQSPVSQVGILLCLPRLRIQAGSEEGMSFLKLPVVHLNTPEQSQGNCIARLKYNHLIQVSTAFLSGLQALNMAKAVAVGLAVSKVGL